MNRQNPDALLKAILTERSVNENAGKLKIFFGYAAGVGKTYSMLEAAHAAQKKGIDVVVGYVEPHARPQTLALLEGLEQIPPQTIEYQGMEFKEFDIDKALIRKPELILVDELAHTNAHGSRHAKRYQDIKELLKAGIDVYTTLNVQHIESLNDTVESITGIQVRERIPDDVFDKANQVELIDIESKELIDRIKNGEVYREEQAKRATDNFFTIRNLTALREISLRRCADRVNILTAIDRIKNFGEYHTDEHILVCLSPSPSNKKVIRNAARMAGAFKGDFTAIYIETPDYSQQREEYKKQLRENMKLAEQLGAVIETVHGEDVPYQIAEFARLSAVTKVVIGRSDIGRRRLIGKASLAEKLNTYGADLDIYIIPDGDKSRQYRRYKAKSTVPLAAFTKDLLKSIAVLAAVTCIGVAFSELDFSEANIMMVYILGVLITSIITSGRLYSIASSVASVLVFNFFFTDPYFTFRAYDTGYPATFLIMFLVAFISSSLATRLKKNAKQAAYTAFRVKVLFDTNQQLQKAQNDREIIEAAADQLLKLLDRDIVVYPVEEESLGKPIVFPVIDGTSTQGYLTSQEEAVARWVFINNKYAGATTDTLSGAACLYLAIRIKERVYGVVGIAMREGVLDSFEKSVMLSILGECALALENSKNAKEKEKAAVIAKNEQLRANLLRSISHDLRTPLTSISGNASNLLSNGDKFDEDSKKQIYTDIYDDSMWLINLVENILAVTRIEEGKINLRMSTELMDEVIDEALLHINRKKTEHKIVVNSTKEFILAKIDARLIVQVIINIVDNAIKYTPVGSEIKILTDMEKDKVVVEISDDGSGIDDEIKEKVFDMFYSGNNTVADSRRSLGLGLALCRSIINAHGGEIEVLDNVPHGTVFRFTLPAGEVDLHE